MTMERRTAKMKATGLEMETVEIKMRMTPMGIKARRMTRMGT